MQRYLWLVCLCLLLASCKVQDIELVRFNNVGVSQSIDGKPQLSLNVTLNNPNNFNISIKKTKLDLKINDEDGGRISLAEKVMVEKSAQADYTFLLQGEQEKIQAAILRAGLPILLSGKVTVNIRGWIKGKAFGLGEKVKIDESRSISVKDLNLPGN